MKGDRFDPDSIRGLLAAQELAEGPGGRTGLVMVRYVLLATDRTESSVIGLWAGTGGRRCEVQRQPGETLDELEARANPGASWRAYPLPICTQDATAISMADWDAAVNTHAETPDGDAGNST